MPAGFSDPDVPDGERIAYEGLIGEQRIGEGEHVVERVEIDGHDHYRQRVEVSVRERARMQAEVLFRRRRERVLAESYRVETRDEDKLVGIEEAHFRDVRVLQFGGEIEPYPRDITPLLGCGLALRGIDLSPEARGSLTVWLASTLSWELTTRVEEVEEVSVPAGSFQAARVRLFPDLQPVARNLHTLVEHLMPPLRVHLDLEPPHRMLRFSFPTGPFPWNDRGLIHAVEIDPGG